LGGELAISQNKSGRTLVRPLDEATI